MPRSRNRAIEARSATMGRPPVRLWSKGTIRSPFGWFVSAIIILAAPTCGQGPQASSEPQPPTEPSDPTRIAGLTPRAGPHGTDLANLRAETTEKLKAFEAASPTSAPASATTTGAGPRPGSSTTSTPAPSLETADDEPLRDLLQDRLRWLDEYDKASAALKRATHPEPNPDKRGAEAKDALGRLQAILAQTGTQAEALLPPAFRGRMAGGSPALSAEMKEALEATTNELKDGKSKLETLRTEVVNWESLQNARRAERDKLFQRVAMMKARGLEREADAGASTARARRLAQERMINFGCQAWVEARRLQAVEAQILLETKLAGVRELSVQVCQARIRVAEKTLELMQQRYSAAAERQERDLKEKAAHQENTARRSEDPLERFRGRRLAELLELEALVIKNEQALATSPPPSLDEQRSLADHAADDFARTRELVDDGRVSRLDAIRLNNEFRRIGPERDRLLRNEMAAIEARLQYYEDALTSVEIELLQDSLHDRSEHELLRERLPESRWGEGEALLAELERKHRALLVRRRMALERLTDCTAQTLNQVARRLGILDEEYGFIRTHLFWVRDQEPIGLATLSQGVREFQHLVKALLRLAQETAKPRLWGRPSAEFVVAALAVLGLPAGLVRLRRGLRILIERDLPSNE